MGDKEWRESVKCIKPTYICDMCRTKIKDGVFLSVEDINICKICYKKLLKWVMQQYKEIG